MIWIELLLSATAVLLAAAAFKRADSAAARQSQDNSRETVLHEELNLVRERIEALPGRIADETAASPLREALEAVRESIQRMGAAFDTQADSTREAVKDASGAVSASVEKNLSGLIAPLEGLASLGARLQEIAAAQAAQTKAAAESASELRATIESADSRLEARLEPLERIAAALQDLRCDLPARIAQEIASRPAPELEELAAAVRDSGHLRGDVAQQVAQAVSSVSLELAAATAQARADRDASSDSLEAAMARLESLVAQVRTTLEPLESALSGHGETVRPLAQALEAARAQLEEAAGTQRANQVEFSASVDVFTRSAMELSTGLSAFAREGDSEGAEDPRKAQAALLEALERILSGFSESLRALLSESDLRTRETLAELAARLPGGQEPS